MKKTIILAVIFFALSLKAQNVTGIITDSTGVRLSGLKIELYSFGKSTSTFSNSEGVFSFYFPTGVKENMLPEGYSISNNYPNPFNPKTRIDFTLPKTSDVKIEVFNITGQRVRDISNANFPAGNNHMDIELEGLPNGLYFARILIDRNYTVTKKLMLLYGSQHLNVAKTSSFVKIGRQNKDVFLDSLVITGSSIVRTTINILTYLTDNSLDLGKIVVVKFPDNAGIPCPEIPSFVYGGKKYNTVLIGNQCWMKENLDIGVLIKNDQISSDNHIFEKYCYNDDKSYCDTYGGLYRWNEAMNYSQSGEIIQGICPEGWHLPSVVEFKTFLNFTGYPFQNLMQIGQADGKNTFGFSALLTGVIGIGNSGYSHLGINGYLWSSNDYGGEAYFLFMGKYDKNVYTKTDNKGYGLSVRCIKN